MKVKNNFLTILSLLLFFCINFSEALAATDAKSEAKSVSASKNTTESVSCKGEAQKSKNIHSNYDIFTPLSKNRAKDLDSARKFYYQKNAFSFSFKLGGSFGFTKDAAEIRDDPIIPLSTVDAIAGLSVGSSFGFFLGKKNNFLLALESRFMFDFNNSFTISSESENYHRISYLALKSGYRFPNKNQSSNMMYGLFGFSAVNASVSSVFDDEHIWL